MYFLSQLCTVQSEATGNRSIKQDWCNDLLLACDKYLSKVVLEEGNIGLKQQLHISVSVKCAPGVLKKLQNSTYARHTSETRSKRVTSTLCTLRVRPACVAGCR